jgi:putative colanic acid biosynthesis acetyltransferase WcaF
VDRTTPTATGELDGQPLDVAANRAARKYSLREQALRALWSFGRWLIILSPHPCHGWRRAVLRLFGARVGRQARVHASARLYMPWNVELGEWSAVGPEVFIYSLGKVRIGARATVSYRSHVCAGTHDFIGPGVTVGRGAIVAARAVVVKDVEPLTVVGGHPARPIAPHPGIKRQRG